MPNFCGVINCSHRGDRDRKSFFRVPGIPKRATEANKRLIADRKRRWIAALRRADLTEKKIHNLRICEDHFLSGKPADLHDYNNPDWIPSLKMGYEKNECSWKNHSSKNINSANEEARTEIHGKQLSINEEKSSTIPKIVLNFQNNSGPLIVNNPIRPICFQQSEMFPTGNTCKLNTSAVKWISFRNKYFKTGEGTLNKENTDINLIKEQKLSSAKENFTYEDLLKNLLQIKKPSEFWSISSVSNFVICAKWNKDYICEKKVIVENSLTVRVFLKEWEINLAELVNISCIDDISHLLQKVESYKIV